MRATTKELPIQNDSKKVVRSIRNIVAEVFGVSEESITSATSPDNLPQWDSLHHMNLVLALEEAFNMTFTDEEVTQMLNYSLVVEIIRSRNSDVI